MFIKLWGWKHDLCGNDATANGNDNDDNVISEGERAQQFVGGGVW